MPNTYLEPRKTSAAVTTFEASAFPQSYAAPKTSDLEITRLARVIWRNIGLIILCALICGAIGYGITMIEAPVYRATATVELLGVNNDFLNLREMDPNATTSASASDNYLQTEMELLSSKALVQRTLAKLGKIPASGTLSETDSKLVNDSVKRLRVEQVKESNLLGVFFEDKDPEYAATFINTLVGQAGEQSIEDRWKSNERLSSLFSKQVDVLRHRMEAAEHELQNYTERSGLLYTGDEESVSEDRLKAVDEELSRARADRMQKESRYTLASTADANSLPEILSNETVRELRQKLSDLERQRADLGATLAPQNPKILQIDAQINQVQDAVNRETAKVVKSIKNEYMAARQREQLLSSATATQARQVSDDSEKAIHYNTLKREVDTTRTLYESMLRRMNDAEIISTVNSSDLRAVDAAAPPRQPAKPNKPLYTAIGFANGLVFAVLFLFVREYNNVIIQAPDNIPSLFPELGVVPTAKGSLRIVSPRPDLPPGKSGLPGPYLGPKAAMQAKESFLKDSFRGIAASILMRHSYSEKALSLVVSSPHPGDGKTSTVFNVGLEIAASGRRVLLIDGDLRRPTLHNFFGQENGAGLSDALQLGDVRVPAADLVRSTGFYNLSFLAAGEGGEKESLSLHADEFRQVLDELSTKFDVILVDSAPFMLIPESRLLAKAADGLILVFRAGKTSYAEAMSIYQRAAHDGTVIFGAILNGWSSQHQGAGYQRYMRKEA